MPLRFSFVWNCGHKNTTISLIKSVTSKTPTLEHTENRTIGIGRWGIRFAHEVEQGGKIYIHDITFSDFAGEDLMGSSNAQRDQLLNEYTERDVLRWVCRIFSIKRDATFAFIPA